MQSVIPIILCAFLIIISVQARSVVSRHEKEISKQLSDKYNSKLLSYLTSQFEKDDSSIDDTETNRQLPKRGFFLFPTRRSNQRYRPIYTYGRKSHWDTFFG